MIETALPVFVYGLLKPGFAGFAELRLDDRVNVIGPDRVHGTLYNLGDYPGLMPGGDDTVAGVLLRPLDAQVLDDMDAYELFDPADPAGSEYIRARLVTTSGASVWAYAYNRPVGDAPVVPRGAWPAPR